MKSCSAMIKKNMSKGVLVPSDFMTRLLKRVMLESGKNTFLIDGFPRSVDNYAEFKKLIRIEPNFVLYLECPEKVMIERLLKRNQGRDDDNMATIKKRIDGMNSMLPVIEHFELELILCKVESGKIDASKSVEEVTEQIFPLLSAWTESAKKRSEGMESMYPVIQRNDLEGIPGKIDAGKSLDEVSVGIEAIAI
ncbi:hypothetical protein IFM89_028543 [Coptis chinensis]|uniref:adenylate kinase n=1 Tax=Coptis chinensis TaxID=261450 RepID=A0A835IGM4_9MAGN|nr:hypothetical protein IFM89_028543 [Coptis chinensis]